MANAINLDNQATLNMDKLYMVKSLFDEVTAFVQQVYVPDVCAVGAMYPEWLKYGSGVTNYLSVPDLPTDTWIVVQHHRGKPRRRGYGRRCQTRRPGADDGNVVAILQLSRDTHRPAPRLPFCVSTRMPSLTGMRHA